MDDYHNQIETFFSRKAMRYTVQRRLIVDDIFAEHGHFEAEMFIRKIRQKHASVSRATLYRTLAYLLEAGVLSKISAQDGKVRYEHTLGHDHHDHLICRTCGAVIEVSSSELEALQNKICRESGFIPSYHVLQIYGQCRQCAE